MEVQRWITQASPALHRREMSAEVDLVAVEDVEGDDKGEVVVVVVVGDRVNSSLSCQTQERIIRLELPFAHIY